MRKIILFAIIIATSITSFAFSSDSCLCLPRVSKNIGHTPIRKNIPIKQVLAQLQTTGGTVTLNSDGSYNMSVPEKKPEVLKEEVKQ